MAEPTLERALALGAEILRAMQPPVNDEGLDRLDTLLDEREGLLRTAMESTASDQANGPDPETLRLLVAQQRALEEQCRRLMGSMLEASGELQEARSSMEAVNRILNPGVRPRWVDQRR